MKDKGYTEGLEEGRKGMRDVITILKSKISLITHRN